MPMLHTFRTQYRKPNRLLSREDKIKLIKLALENPNLKQKEIGDVFGVERSSVAKILKRKNEYLSPDVIDTLTGTAKRSRSERGLVKEAFDIHWMELEQVVYTWYLTSIAEEQVITDDNILDKAQKVAIKFGMRTIMPDQQWLKSFKEKLKLFSQGGNLVNQMSVSPADGKDAVSCSMNSRTMGREGHSVPFQSISSGHTILTEPSIRTSTSLPLEPGGLPLPDHSSVGAFRRRQSCPLPAVTTFSHHPHTVRGRQQLMSSVASSSTCSDGQKESLIVEQMAENTFFYKAGI